MKKLLLSGLLASFALFSGAQDIAVTLTSPTANGNVTSGGQFNFDVTITNSGTIALTTADSVLIAPRVGGSLLPTQSGAPLIWLVNQDIAANGGTYNFTQPLGLQGGPTGSLEICAVSAVLGSVWDVETDTTNNVNCVTVNYTNNIGLGEISLVTLTDNSFYSNGVFNVRLTSTLGYNSMSFELISLTGKVVQSNTFAVSGSGVSEDIQISAPAKGIYIARLTSNGKPVSTKKVVVE